MRWGARGAPQVRTRSRFEKRKKKNSASEKKHFAFLLKTLRRSILLFFPCSPTTKTSPFCRATPWASLTSSGRRTARYVLLPVCAAPREANEQMHLDDGPVLLGCQLREALPSPGLSPQLSLLPVSSLAGWHSADVFYDRVEFWSEGGVLEVVGPRSRNDGRRPTSFFVFLRRSCLTPS